MQRRPGSGRTSKTLEAQTRLLELAQAARGCPKLHRQLRHEGHRINHKRTERLYRRHGLLIRRLRRLVREVRNPLWQPIHPGQCQSMDFMGDSLADGRAYRTFNVIDDHARGALAIEVDISMTTNRIVCVLNRLCDCMAYRNRSAANNGPEFRADALQDWAKDKGIRWDFIQPDCPAQNTYIERFNGTYRIEVLVATQAGIHTANFRLFGHPQRGLGPLRSVALADLWQGSHAVTGFRTCLPSP